MTLEAIAKADGTVSKDTVHRALENSTFANEKVNLPDKTIGQDGKARPTKYKPRKQKTGFLKKPENPGEAALGSGHSAREGKEWPLF